MFELRDLMLIAGVCCLCPGCLRWGLEDIAEASYASDVSDAGQDVGDGVGWRFDAGAGVDVFEDASWTRVAPSPNEVGAGAQLTDAHNVHLAVRDDQTIFAAWSDDSTGRRDVYLKYWDGEVWQALGSSSDPGGISATRTESYLGDLVLDDAG
ncbi:MAG: hypothetical protein IPK13_16000 [Deltaproteobacteria bacterium]|nr:hypothetical protein [Deltaproteobacteria bacterium]